GEVSLAELEIERLLDEYPKSRYRPLAQFHLGKKLFELDRLEEAIEVFSGVRENYPKFKLKGELLSFIAKTSYELGDYETSLGNYEQMMKEGKTDTQKREGLIGTARCHSRLEQHERALEIYNSALESAKFPEDRAEASLGIDVEYTFLGRSAEAAKGFEEIILEHEKTRYSAAAWYELGLLYKGFKDDPFQDSIPLDSVALPVFGLDSTKMARLEGLSQDLLSLSLAKTAFGNVRRNDTYSPLAGPAQQHIDDIDLLYDIVEQMEASDSSSSRDALARLQFLQAEYYESTGEMGRARAGYERLVFEYPGSIYTPKTIMKMFEISDELGDSVRAGQSLELLVACFPETRYADQARRLLGLPVPERMEFGFYFDELAAHRPAKIVASREAAIAAGMEVPEHETWLQMRRRLYIQSLTGGGG
ncbi:MAG: hypothetical protein U9P14_04790, partial [Gemmatimonadota bacterium]|nr:hypothetical protein [Gemmatimonadota bacterium]